MNRPLLFALSAHGCIYPNPMHFTARCYTERSYTSACRLSLRPSICLSVSLSITFRYRDHIGWNTSKIISPLISLRFMLGLTPTWAIWFNGNIPKLGWNGVGQEHKTPVISPKRCKMQDRNKVTSRIRDFDWCRNQ